MTKRASPSIRFAAVLLLMPFGALAATNSVVDTVHNLSASGPGSVRALSEDRVCIFCHTPHGSRANAPLWNRRDSSAHYIPYDSPTLSAKPGQPTGSSKLCLSCHDGTIALGDLVSENAVISTGGSMDSAHSLIGTDLSDDHPISFAYSEAMSGAGSELAAPGSWNSEIRLDNAGMMQCTTCHDPHNDEWGKFLVMDNSGATLCRECHTIPGFDETAHAQSTKTWNGSSRDPWPHTEYTSVSENACMNCHQSHHAPSHEELLTNSRDEEVCLTCHDGGVGDGAIGAAFRKSYRHPVRETSGGHRPGEELTGTADHVTCVDCHNPHKAVDRPAEAPGVPGLLEGVSGLTAGGTPIGEANFEYEVCFKCHAEDTGRSWTGITRQITANSIRREFTAGAPSYHPVVSPGQNPNVPSLISPLTPASMIYCSDCHGDDAPAPGSGTSGPHGSRFRYLLKLEYQIGDNIGEGPTAYALCYSCHDRNSILGDQSFPQHRRHIVNASTPCSVCHDAHGIDSNEGNAINNAHLISFDLSVVEPLPGRDRPEYISTSPNSGQSSLRCHNVDHDGRTY